jgi:ADP-ribose pyrophosphatase
MNQEVELWETVQSEELADCRVFRVREKHARSGNKTGKFYVIENPDWVNVIAVTKNREVLFIEQFRHGTEEIVLEIPGGMVDDGEAAETAARRELLEETGYSANEFVLLGKSRPNPAIQNNWLYHFAAVDAELTGEVKFDEHESVVSKLYPLGAIAGLVKSGAVTHSLVLAAFQYFSLSDLKE